MKLISISILLFWCHLSYGQRFLDAYKIFKIAEIKSEKNRKVKKKRLAFPSKEINQLDTVFKSYKKRTNFDFNTVDSLKIIWQSSIESGLSDVIIWSNTDSISYTEIWLVDPGVSIKKIVEYNSFLDTTFYGRGFKMVDSRDSLMTLVSKSDFATAKRLSKENPVLDGASFTIIVAIKINGEYIIRKYFLMPFEIRRDLRLR